MNDADAKVYERPEEYKIGFTHGFYDSLSNEDGRYREWRRASVSCASSLPYEEAERLYDEGYYNGFARRIRGLATLEEELLIKVLQSEALPTQRTFEAGTHEMRRRTSKLDESEFVGAVRR